jgi:hypothetical protein
MSISIICTVTKCYDDDHIEKHEMGKALVRGGNDMRNVYKMLVVMPERKRPAGRLWDKWKCNSKMNLKDILLGRSGLDSSG